MPALPDNEGAMHHECGVAAVIDLEGKEDVVPVVRDTLLGLQPRGQLGAGIAWQNSFNGRYINILKDCGLVADVLSDENLLKAGAASPVAIGHTRYATTDRHDPELCHPFRFRAQNDQSEFAMAFNGNILQCDALAEKLRRSDIQPRLTGCDTELIGLMVVRELQKKTQRKMRQAIIDALGKIEGACNAVFLHNGRIFATRDSHGFHPLVYAQKDSLVAVSSESSALHDVWPKARIRSIKPGSMLHIGPNKGVSIEQVWTPEIHRCFMEHVYFADHRSIIDNVSVSNVRYETGKILAEMDRDEPHRDVVVPVPESAKSAARGYGDSSNIRSVEALLRRPVAKRTFIDNGDRTEKVRAKFDLDSSLVNGKSVVLVDDSMVRGTTMRVIVGDIRAAGATEVHVRLASPGIIAPCFYGIDFPTVTELITRKHYDPTAQSSDTLPPDVLRAIAADIGADSVKFLPVSKLADALKSNAEEICTGCITGTYPTPSGAQLYQLANMARSEEKQ